MHVLVVYGSTRGGTAGLAHMVADACAVQGIKTEVRRGGDVRSIEHADAVIVGGALYNNRWHPEAVAFVGRHRADLRRIPVWFFSSGPLDDSARSGALAPVPQVTTLAREIEIRGHMTFGGLLDKRPTGLLGRFAYGTEGDFRDRRQVAEWVERIAQELHGEHQQMVRLIASSTTPAASPMKPTVVIKPFEPDADALGQPAVSAFDAVVPTPSQPPADVTPVRSKRARLRQFLVLDPVPDDEDDGLDLFDEVDAEIEQVEIEQVEELVGDSTRM